MIDIRHPFTIYAKNAQAQDELNKHFNQGALAEKRDLVSVYVTPLQDAPLPISRLVAAVPLMDAVRSSYLPGMMALIKDEAASMAKAAKGARGGNGGGMRVSSAGAGRHP